MRHGQQHVAFLAVGTRGDVQPLAILAANLAKKRGDVKVHFVTNRNHKVLVEAPLTSAGVCSVEYLSLPPATPGTTENDDADQERRQRNASDEQHREECVRALENAFGCSVVSSRTKESSITSGGALQSSGCGDGDGEQLSGLVVINLFALEGWHVAEAMGLPCAVVSPTVVPYAPPSSFARRFERAYPGLYRRLTERDDGAPASWREVEHWLWPVFTERWGRWRSRRLCLNEVPFLSDDGGGDGGVVTAPRKPTKVLYGCSPSIIQVPGYWPDTVHMCGFWFPPDDWETDVRVPPRLLRDFFGVSEQTVDLVKASTGAGVMGRGGVVAIALSTVFDMGLFGGADKAEHVITVLRGALKSSGLKGIFVMSNHDSCLASAWKGLYPPHSHGGGGTTDKKRKLDDDNADESWVGGDETVQGYVGSIPFQQLFPMCVGVIHHAGSGTTAAALRAGVPQIMCPCVFDQFSWAERMSWLGVSPAPLKSSDFFGDEGAETIEGKLSTALAFLSRSDARECAKNLQKNIMSEHEDAVGTALDALESAVGERIILTPERSSNDDGGVQMLELPNGWHVACTAKAEALFLFNEMNAYFRHVAPVADGCIIDVGANIGMFLLATNAWLRRNCDGDGDGDGDDGVPPRTRRYVAVEPLEINAECFKRNMVIHEASAGVELHRCGLTDEVHARKGSLDFTYYPKMPGNSTAHPDEKVALQKNTMKSDFFVGAEVVSCPVSTLSALLDEFHPDIERIDLLKVDVEGAELEVLQGISDDHWSMIRQVVVEVHDVSGRVKTVETLLRCVHLTTQVEPQEFGSNAWLVWGTRRRQPAIHT